MGTSMGKDQFELLADLLKELTGAVRLMTKGYEALAFHLLQMSEADQKTIPVAEYGDTLILECGNHLTSSAQEKIIQDLEDRGVKAIMLCGSIKLAGIQAANGVEEGDGGLYMDGSRQ